MAIIKHPEQRVGVFIDTQNLYHSAKNIYHARAYVVTTESGEEKGFFEALAKIGIETRTKDLQIFFGGAKKADWDVGMAVDAITMAPKLVTALLFTGDGDFIPLVEYLKVHSGCQVEVASFGRSTSGRLKEATDHFLDLDEDPKRYLMNYRGGTRRPNIRMSEPADTSDADVQKEIKEISKITGVE